jgi:2-oxoglutarate ferredoxin oxidoreductase subunit gamma|tara:strand:- start:46 stop:579 length:534 start_codon:yes stop_codon:yes gene_type:complete
MTEHKIITAGFGGQGIVLAGSLLANAAILENKKVAGIVSYGAEVRGGTSSSTTIISDEDVYSPIIDKPNIVVALNQPSLDKYKDKIEKNGFLVINTSLAEDIEGKDINVIRINATEIAYELGNVRVANIVAIGALIKKSGILQFNNLKKVLSSVLKGKQELVEINEKALEKGAELCS